MQYVKALRAAGMAVVLILAAPALGTASAASVAGVQVAQTTPLRMVGPRAQRCIASCAQKAASCYRNARNNSARESCELYGSRCRRGC